MLTDLPGRSAVVTGAAGGIGLAMARLFASEGMNVVLADVEEPALDKAVAEVGACAVRGARAIGVATDVSLPESVDVLADCAFEAFPSIDVLCNNAGVGSGAEARLAARTRRLAVGLRGQHLGRLPRHPGLPAAHDRPGTPGHVVNTSPPATAASRRCPRHRVCRDQGGDRHDDRSALRHS